MDIYNTIIAVMDDLGAIPKSRQNKQQGFLYRGVDDVMNALNPIMVKHGLFVVPEILSYQREERTTKTGGNLIYSIITVKYTFLVKDGSSVSAVVVGEGMDSSDKSSNKAMSAAFKYAMFQVFCVATEEMVDPDGDTLPNSEKVSKKPATRTPSTGGEPMTEARWARFWEIAGADGWTKEEVVDFAFTVSNEVGGHELSAYTRTQAQKLMQVMKKARSLQDKTLEPDGEKQKFGQ